MTQQIIDRKSVFFILRTWNRKRNYAIRALRMELVRMVVDNRQRRDFQLAAIQRVLLLRDDGKIGDTVVATCLLRTLRNNGYQVDVLARASNSAVIDCNPHVRQIFLREDINIIEKLKQQNYDLVIDMGDNMSPGYLRFLKSFVTNSLLGFNKSRYRLFNYSIVYHDYHSHISKRYLRVMQILKLKDISLDYQLFYPLTEQKNIQRFLSMLPVGKQLVINPFSSSAHRTMIQSQLTELIHLLQHNIKNINIILLDAENRLAQYTLPGVYKSPFTSLHSAIALIEHADMVISPDTSIVHIAAAYKKPLVALYTNDWHGCFNNNSVWAPNYPEAIQHKAPVSQPQVAAIAGADIVTAVQKLLEKQNY